MTVRKTKKVKKKAVRKNKYSNKKIMIDNIQFDSKLEAEYYVHLKKLKEEMKIKGFELQPEYKLLDAYIVVKNNIYLEGTKEYKKYKNSKLKDRDVREVNYIADFLIYNNDGTKTVVDVKGQETEVFKIKRKMFDIKYPNENLLLLDKYQGEWKDKDEIKKIKSQKRRERNKIKRDKEEEKLIKEFHETKNKESYLNKIHKNKILTKAGKRNLIKKLINDYKLKNKEELIKKYCN